MITCQVVVSRKIFICLRILFTPVHPRRKELKKRNLKSQLPYKLFVKVLQQQCFDLANMYSPFLLWASEIICPGCMQNKIYFSSCDFKFLRGYCIGIYAYIIYGIYAIWWPQEWGGYAYMEYQEILRTNLVSSGRHVQMKSKSKLKLKRTTSH